MLLFFIFYANFYRLARARFLWERNKQIRPTSFALQTLVKNRLGVASWSWSRRLFWRSYSSLEMTYTVCRRQMLLGQPTANDLSARTQNCPAKCDAELTIVG